jgi:hypothetical protein
MSAEGEIGGIYLERAALQQHADILKSQGWSVETEAPVAGFRVDLVARRGGQTRYYEFKLAGGAREGGLAARLAQLQSIARREGAAFRLVFVRPPRRMTIEIEGIETALLNALVDDVPSEVQDIAGHTLVDDVSGVDLTLIEIHGTLAHVGGSAALGVTLQTGGGEHVGTEEFPFEFEATVDLAAMVVTEVHVTSMDLTSWYGDIEPDDSEEETPDDEDGPKPPF